MSLTKQGEVYHSARVMMLEARQVSYTYPGAERPAVNALSLALAPGEFLALVGPNGSGKSTLARLLNGLLMPKTGTVSADGLDAADPAALQEVRRRVGLVFQDPDNQLLAGTVEEDAAFGLENLCLPPAEIASRVDSVLDRLGLTALRSRPPHRLSGGQKQRVALAGVLAMQPAYLILDEATSMLDAVARRQVLAAVAAVRASLGLGVLLITHRLEEALAADRVAIMESGRLTHCGPPAEVFAVPANLAAAGLEVPDLLKLLAKLRSAGKAPAGGCISGEELVAGLWRLKYGA